MKKIQSVLIFFLLCITSSTRSIQQQNVHDFIIQNGLKFGNKTANLMFLTEHFKGKQKIQIPHFQGLSHDDVWNLFSPEQKDSILRHHELFQVELIKHNHLTEEAKQHLSSIRNVCETLKNIDSQKIVDFISPFLENAQKQNISLIVRSTGHEDDIEVSNAGGNLSIANIPAAPEKIKSALAKVVSSYFSEKSITQRLAAQDKKLTTAPVFMPVLLQHMIQENKEQNITQIPRSGVVFSTEAEGETPGITLIQACLGKNEAVVNGLLPVDSYYVDQLFSIYPIIQKKRYRLINQKSKLAYQQNSEDLQNKSTLSKEEVIDLAHIAKDLESVYKYPIDMEFTIQNETIYLLQARPLKKNKKRPSYIKKEILSSFEPNHIFHGKTIGVGNAEAQIITTPNNLIIDTTLYNAVNKQFLPRIAKNHLEKKQIKGFIIAQDAPSTSHESIICRNNKKPVFVFDKETIEYFKKNQPLLIDPQQSLVVVGKTAPSNPFEEGWITHPTPSKMSVLAEFITQNNILEVPSSNNPIQLSAQNIIYNLTHEEDYKKNKEQINQLALQIVSDINHLLENKSCEYTEEIHNIESYILQALQGNLNVLDTNENVLLKKLFFLSRIEALINQEPTKQTINTFSLTSIKQKIKHDAAVLNQLQISPNNKYKKTFIHAAKAASHALTPELATQWEDFLSQMNTILDDKTEQQLATMIQTIDDLDALPLWINTSVYKTLQQETDFNKQLEILLTEYHASKDFIIFLKEIVDNFSTFATESFALPEAFDKQWPLFHELLKKSFLQEHFIHKFEKTTSFARLMTTEALKTTIDTYDNAIKALTGSTEYKKDKLHTQRFKTMVKTYFELFKMFCSMKSLHEELEELSTNDYRYKGIKKYLETLENIWLMLEFKNENQFVPSTGFNIAGAMLGSKAGVYTFLDAEGIKNEITVEDFFSLIHQNLLVICAILHKKEQGSIPLPKKIELFKKKFENITLPVTEVTTYARLVGINFSHHKVHFLYNIALREHSSTYEIIYDTKTEQISFLGTFMGNTCLRWKNIADASEIVNNVTHLKPSQDVFFDKERGRVSFGWFVSNPEDEELIIELVKVYVQSTFVDFYNTIILDNFVMLLSPERHLNKKYKFVCHGIAKAGIMRNNELFHGMLEKFFNTSSNKKDYDFILKLITDIIAEHKILTNPLFFIIKNMLFKKIIPAQDSLFDALKNLDPMEYPYLMNLYPLIADLTSAQWVGNKVLDFLQSKIHNIDRSYPTLKSIILQKKIDLPSLIDNIMKLLQTKDAIDEKIINKLFSTLLQYSIESEEEKKTIVHFFRFWIQKELPLKLGSNDIKHPIKNTNLLLDLYTKISPISEKQAEILIGLALEKQVMYRQIDNLKTVQKVIQGAIIEDHIKKRYLKQLERKLFEVRDRHSTT